MFFLWPIGAVCSGAGCDGRRGYREEDTSTSELFSSQTHFVGSLCFVIRINRGDFIEIWDINCNLGAQEESLDARKGKTYETVCWGCGLRVILSSFTSVFQCGWCGAISNDKPRKRKPDSPCFSRWRRLRDRFFISVVLLFMSFVICGGLWAIYPIVFSISNFCGTFHCTATILLSISTVSTFLLSSFSSPGAPAETAWGDYAVVGKGRLEDYTFCSYCSKPKPPRAHHCRSCRICVMDMDHHCPFIGNCVGGGNHRFFVWFLISAVLSCAYIVTMAAFSWWMMWPPLDPHHLSASHYDTESTSIFRQALVAVVSALTMLSPRELLLLYLGVSSLSISIGIIALLFQQLRFIYEGQTYLNQLTSAGFGEKGCQNVLRFFGCPYWAYRVLLLDRPNNSKKL